MRSKEVRSQKAIKRIAYLVHYVSAVILVIMMFFVTVGVIMRYLFNRPILGDFEIIQLMLGLLIAFGLAYTALQKGHVRVELFVSSLSIRRQAILEGIMSIICMAFISLMIWQNTIYVGEAFDNWVKTQSLGIPLFPFIAALDIGLVLFWGVILVEFFESISKARRQ